MSFDVQSGVAMVQSASANGGRQTCLNRVEAAGPRRLPAFWRGRPQGRPRWSSPFSSAAWPLPGPPRPGSPPEAHTGTVSGGVGQVTQRMECGQLLRLPPEVPQAGNPSPPFLGVKLAKWGHITTLRSSWLPDRHETDRWIVSWPSGSPRMPLSPRIPTACPSPGLGSSQRGIPVPVCK